MASDWTVELSDEVATWYRALSPKDRARADRAIGLLTERGAALRMPHARRLDDGLWELRFNCEQVARRVTYTIDPGRKVVTLTTFRKQRNNERVEVRRARNVLKRRRGKGHG
ncbi:MAG: type II toxin-antitoxin system RelE/ParE family toxin [Nocardioidaceae bacterium]